MTSVKSFIESLPKTQNTSIENYEIEYKFKGFEEVSFNKLKENLIAISDDETREGWGNYVKDSFTDYIDNNVRVTVKDKKIINIIRKTVQKQEFIGQDKITMSLEKKLTSDKKLERNLDPNLLKREKERFSFPVKDFLQIDLTKVIQNNELKYEVEVELYKTNTQCLELFEQVLQNIDKYRISNTGIINFYNYAMTNIPKTFPNLIYGSVSRARDLKIEDITSGGILKNYQLSVKADGEHRFLVFHSSGVWLVFPKNTIERLGDIVGYEGLIDTIIAGELIRKNDMKDKNLVTETPIFIPFDVNMLQGIKYSTIPNYDTRRNSIINFLPEDTYLKLNNKNKLMFKYKKYFTVNSVDTFYKSMNNVLDERENVFYKEDGIIITPIDSTYITEGAKIKELPLNQRILSNYPDVCKWKPPELLTVDLRFINDKFYAKQGDKEIDIKQLTDLKDLKISGQDLENNRIYEFRPIMKNGLEFVALRPRQDKPFPNKTDVIINLYKLSLNPIKEDTLRGKDITLMRKYHNMIKQNVFQSVPDKSFLIDVGSGRGGDISKWNKFSKVLAIEPDQENYDELYQRVEKRRNKNVEISLLKSQFEDEVKIGNSVADFLPQVIGKNEEVYLSFMFSMSFFWGPGGVSRITSVINRINEIIRIRGGDKLKILFVTISGERIDKLIETGVKSTNYKTVDLNTIRIQKFDGEEGHEITITDSKTVYRTQKEFSVYVEEFFQNINYTYKNNTYNTTNILMSEPEKIYTSLVMSGLAEFYNKPVVYYPQKRLPVSITTAIKYDENYYMEGCDEYSPVPLLGSNVFRIATLDYGFSLLHSLLKLLSQRYSENDSVLRTKNVEQLMKKLNYNYDLKHISDILKHSIIVFEQSRKTEYGNYPNKIFLYKHKDKTYEPLVRKVNYDIYTVFN